MAIKLITHSPKAYSHYRGQLSLSGELLAKKTNIPLEKIEKGQNPEVDTIFTFNQIKKIAEVLLIPEFFFII